MTPRQIFFNAMPGSRPAKVRLPPQVEIWQSNPSIGVPAHAFGVGVLRNTGGNEAKFSFDDLIIPVLVFQGQRG